MPIRRTATAIVVIATLMLAIAAPAGAATETTTRGTAATSSLPLEITASNLQAKLGEVSLVATTDGDVDERAPWSAVGLTLADIGGARFGELQVTSDGTTTNPGQSFDEDTTLGSVGATAARLLAVADDTAGSATAAVTTLSSEATVLSALDLSAEITDVVSSVDDTGAAATHTLTLAGIDLDVAAILGGILAELPLDTLIALAGDLGVTVPDGLGDTSAVVDATETLLLDVAAAVDAAGLVETAAADLLDADGGTLAELQALIDQVTALDPADADFLTDLQSILNDAAFPADCDVDLTDAAVIVDLDALKTSIITCLGTEVTDHLLTLADEESALSEAVTAYLGAVEDVVLSAGAIDGSSLSGILDGLTDLVNGLLAVDLGGIGEITVRQQVRAIGSSLDGSSASHTCRATTITVPGADDVEILDCDADGTDALQTAVDTITGTLGTILDTVGGVDVGDGVSLELFGNVQDTVAQRDDGFVTASSVMEILRLTVPDITVRACDVAVVGETACALGGDLDILSPLADAVGDLEDAQAAVDTALGTVADLLTALSSTIDGTPAEDPVTAVNTAIGILQAALNDLDFGTLGDAAGVSLPGATIVVDPQLEAEHQVTTASVDGPTTPADPAPDSPGDKPTLPNTGGGAALLAVLALGAGAWLWRSRRDEA